jgi:putative addiction module component (TIGR02574 family)
MTKQQLMKQAMKLDTGERRELAEALWESVGDPEELPPALKAELERRLAESKANPDQGMPLDEFLHWLHSRPIPSSSTTTSEGR